MYNYDELLKNPYLDLKESKYDEVLKSILSQCEKGYTHLQGTNYVFYGDKLLRIVKGNLNFSEDCFTETVIKDRKFTLKTYFVTEKQEYKKICFQETFTAECSFKVYKTDFYEKEPVFK